MPERRGRESVVTTSDEIQNALLAIHSRLGTIEGKINLVARAEREALLNILEDVIRKDPLLGQIYLLVDGNRSQKDVVEALQRFGVTVSQPTVSRRMRDLVREYGIADPVGEGAILRQDRSVEDMLNLSVRVRRWLEEGGHTVPEEPKRRRSKSKA
jgi:hypothetical protein